MQENRSRRELMQRCVATVILVFVTLSGRPVHAQRLLDDGAGWETLEDCRLRHAWSNDGDSFHVEHRGREYIFRLYFVDAPETGTYYKDRVKEQAKYFDISGEAAVRVGRQAAEFTVQELQNTFTVVTRWQNARGNGDLPRFYAGVRVDGRDLAERLMEQGMVRRRGEQASYPGTDASIFRHRLMDLEEQAKAEGLGGWSDAWERYAPGTPVPEMGPHVPAATRIDLNAASAEELTRIPKIGTNLAQVVIGGRPYESIDDLRELPGLGPKTLEKIRPYLKID